MALGKLRLTGQALCLCVLSLAGCRAHVQKALLSDQPPQQHQQEVAANYTVGCPDVLAASVVSLPYSRTYRQAVAADGQLDLGTLGKLRVEGKTAAEITAEVARLARVPPGQVRVRVVEHLSKQVYVFGQVTGMQRAVAYHGPETVLDVLQRAGGISPGAQLEEVFVVRSNVARGGRPEVFPVELKDIVMQRDQKTNIRLEPFDQIHIGETRRSRFLKAVPPVLRPFYERMAGIQGPQWRRLRTAQDQTNKLVTTDHLPDLPMRRKNFDNSF